MSINIGLNYLKVFNSVSDIFQVDFGVCVTLLRRLVLTPHFSGLFTDPRSRKGSDCSEYVNFKAGFEGGIGIGALAYRD